MNILLLDGYRFKGFYNLYELIENKSKFLNCYDLFHIKQLIQKNKLPCFTGTQPVA